MHVQVGIKEAAKSLGVSTSTLKRLCDQSIVPSFRTPGGHRRFDRTLIDIARRHLLGQPLNPELPSSDQTWYSLLLSGSEAGLRQYLMEKGAAGDLVESLDSILLQSILAINELSRFGESTYRFHMAYQAALNAITWKSTRFLTRHRCQSRVFGISSGLAVDDVGSAMIELALRMSRLDSLALRCFSGVEQLASLATQVQASHIWLCHLTDRTISLLNQQIEYLSRHMHSESELLVLTTPEALGSIDRNRNLQVFTRPSQLLTLQISGISLSAQL